MSRELPSWASAGKDERPRATWPADLARVVKGWRWGRRNTPPHGVPEVERAKRPPRREHRPGAPWSLWRQGVITTVSGADGLANIDPPVVVAANHQSLLDSQVLRGVLPRSWRAVAKDPEAALAAGRSVIVFPEGEPSSDGHLGEFSDEAAELAALHHVPVIPVAISGTYNLKAIMSLRVLRTRPLVRVRFGAPLHPRTRPIASATAELRAAIADLLELKHSSWWSQLRRGGEPPDPETMGTWRRIWTDLRPRRTRDQRRAARIWASPVRRGERP